MTIKKVTKLQNKLMAELGVETCCLDFGVLSPVPCLPLALVGIQKSKQDKKTNKKTTQTHT